MSKNSFTVYYHPPVTTQPSSGTENVLVPVYNKSTFDQFGSTYATYVSLLQLYYDKLGTDLAGVQFTNRQTIVNSASSTPYTVAKIENEFLFEDGTIHTALSVFNKTNNYGVGLSDIKGKYSIISGNGAYLNAKGYVEVDTENNIKCYTFTFE